MTLSFEIECLVLCLFWKGKEVKRKRKQLLVVVGYVWQLMACQDWECVMRGGAVWRNPSFSHPIISQQSLRDFYGLQNILQLKHAPQNILVTFIKPKVFAFLLFIHGWFDHILNIVKLFAAIIGKYFSYLFSIWNFSIVHSYPSRSLTSKDRKQRLCINITLWM